jgi:hypothetical protein
MTDWREMLAFNMEFAESRLIEAGDVRPMATVHGSDNTAHTIAMNMSDDAHKEQSLRFVRLLATAHDADAVSTIGEMWMRTMFPYHGESEAEYMARVDAVRPRDAEDRKEVVMCQLYYRDAAGSVRELSNSREIIRGADGKPTGLKPSEYPDAEVIFSEGPMTDLLPKRKPTAEQMRYARQLIKRLGIEGIPL